MPQTYNFNQPIAVDSSGLFAQSVQYSAFASDTSLATEVPLQNARYIRWTLFTGKNLTGTNMGTATWDSGTLTVQQEFSGWTVDQIIAYLYPPPGSTT